MKQDKSSPLLHSQMRSSMTKPFSEARLDSVTVNSPYLGALLERNEEKLSRANEKLNKILNSTCAPEYIEKATKQMEACLNLLYRSRAKLLTLLEEQQSAVTDEL
eukprot:2689261-Rhodomonas_salina.1